MNTVIESAFLDAASDLDGMDVVEHRTGVSSDENPPDEAALIVSCQECEHAAGSLWKATVNFRLETSAVDGQRQYHAGRLSSLRAWLADSEAVSVAMSEQNIGMAGLFVRSSKTSIESTRWVAEIEIIAGVDTSAMT